MLLMQNSARQLRLATVVGEAGLANIGRKTFYLRGFQKFEAPKFGFARATGAADFHHPAQKISLYTILLCNVSDSLDTGRASKSCRRDALKGSRRVAKRLLYIEDEAGSKGLTKSVNPTLAEPHGASPTEESRARKI
jgi:hypothetical protein